jgi:hypothetical protein
LVLAAIIASAWAARAQAAPGDYSQFERCLGPKGANTIFERWVGNAESALSFSTRTRMNLALEVGKGRTSQAPRTVTVHKLKRANTTATLLSPELAERDELFPDVLELTLTNDVDSYLLEFVPNGNAAAKESCVLTFGSAWTWSAERLAYRFPFDAAKDQFLAGRLSLAVAKQQLYGGQDGPPQRLFLEPLRDSPLPLPRVRAWEQDPGFTAFDWDGKSQSLRISGGAPAYNLWLCSPGPTLSPRPVCLGIVQFELNADPIAIRVKSDVATLRQTAPLRGLPNGQLVTYALIGDPSTSTSMTYEYGGGAPSPALPQDVKDSFIKSQRNLEYTVALSGSADSERAGRRCPPELVQGLTQVRVFAGTTGGGFDVHACLYQRDNTDRTWRLVPDAPAGDAPEQKILNAVRLQLCTSPTLCFPAGTLGARTQLGFRLNGERSGNLALQAEGAGDGPMLLEPSPVTLSTVKATYLPRLPSATTTGGDASTLTLKSFTKVEWDSQKQATCIEGDWKRYGTEVIDVGATLVLRTGKTQQVLGDGRWRVVAGEQKDQLCPELNDAQIQQLLTSARLALASGHSASLDAVQGGQIVGRHVIVDGPKRPAITGIELHVTKAQGGGTLMSFLRAEPLPALGTVCVLTESDWGELLSLDPSRIVLRGDAGETFARFRSKAADPQHHPFGRPAEASKTSDNHWRYCSAIAQPGMTSDSSALILTKPVAPSVGARSATLSYDDAEGCGSGRPCAELKAERSRARTGTNALSAFHTGLAWGHVFSFEKQAPPNELRVFLAAPLALYEARPVSWLSFSAETGVSLGLGAGKAVIADSFTTRVSLPISGYAGICLGASGLRSSLGLTPQLCGGAFLDVVTFRTISTSQNPSPSAGTEWMGFTPFLSVGIGEF